MRLFASCICCRAVAPGAWAALALRLHWTSDVETGRGEVDVSGNGRHALQVSAANPRQHRPASRKLGKGIFGGAGKIHSQSPVADVSARL